MKTILTALHMDAQIDAAIADAHDAVHGLLGLFTYDNLGDSLGDPRKTDRHLILDAASLLDIEVSASKAGVPIEAERRVLLGGALLLVRQIIEQHAWGFLVGNDDAERDSNIALVERFEAARRTITVACYDLEAMMDD